MSAKPKLFDVLKNNDIYARLDRDGNLYFWQHTTFGGYDATTGLLDVIPRYEIEALVKYLKAEGEVDLAVKYGDVFATVLDRVMYGKTGNDD